MLPPGTTWDGPLPAAPDPGFEDSAAAGDAITADPVTGFLFLLQLALSARTAHLTVVPAGGAPAAGDLASCYGWGPGPGGRPEPGGTWIGAVEETKDGRRVYLRPQQAYDVACRYAEELADSFELTRAQLDDALRKSGLLKTEKTKEGTRYTVRRPLPGADTDGDDRQRVWDIPEEALLGGGPASAPAAHPRGASAALRTALAELPAATPAPVFRPAGELKEGQRIVLNFTDGQALAATVYSLDPDPTSQSRPEPDGISRRILNYIGDNGEPGFVRVRSDHPIRMAGPEGSTGGNQR
jgi:hypothetical protein